MDKFLYAECKICGAKSVEPFHFWREHHSKEADYCLTHERRVSKLTGEPIKFKNREFYFNSDFNDKNEFKAWIKANPEEGKTYSIDFLENRFKSGKSIYAPSQVELRSLCCPNILWYQKFFNYNLQCSSIGMNVRFKYNLKDEELEPPFLFKGTVVIDTREQRALSLSKLGITEVSRKLDYGDYRAEDSVNNHIFIERKSLSDFVSTLSGRYDRFCREIERAQSNNHYLIILVEESISNAMYFNKLPHVSKNIKASPEFVFHKVRELMQTYPNIQFVFVDGRVKAAEFLQKIYSLSIDPSSLDLQYLLDAKRI